MIRSLRNLLVALAACTAATFTHAADSIFINNPSFQADVFGIFPGYRGGANPANITGWTGGGGINGSDIGAGTPFADNGAYPDGTRVAFIQGTGSLSQTVGGFIPGQSYWVQVWTNARACCGDVPRVSVTMNGVPLLNLQALQPVGGSAPYYLANFLWTANSAAPVLAISSQSAAGGDASAVFDAISIIKRGADEVVIANPSFEASGQGLVAPGYYLNIAGWERFATTGNTGVNTSVGPFHDNGVIPDGLNVLLLQQAAGVRQSIAGLEPGRTYRLALRYNARAATGAAQFRVMINGQTALDAPVSAVGAALPYSALTFDFTATAETVSLSMENVGLSADSTVLVDDVHLTTIGAPVPPVFALPSPAVPGGAGGIVTFNEIHYNPAVIGAPEWIEIVNQSSLRADLSGWKITGGIAFTFADGTTLEPGAFLVVSSVAGNPAGALGPFTGSLDGAGDTIRLRTKQGWLMDEMTYGVSGDWPATPDGTGPSLAKRAVHFASDTSESWVASTAAGGTPGAANFAITPAPATAAAHVAGPVVINEIMYHSRPTFANGATPYSENPLEWIELHNRTAAPVDISGWKLDDAVSFTFPAGTTLAAGGFIVVNDAQFSGSLANNGDAIKLRDAAGALVDKVRYRSEGRWAAFADGGGASLELRDPDADNTKPESWAASDESAKTGWQTVTYTASGLEPPGSNNPNVWREFLAGMLDAGEVLIDDIVVREATSGSVNLIQNGTFEGDTLGQPPLKWRCLGTHKQSVVVQDPTGPGKALKIVATDMHEHTYNTCSTTFSGNVALDPTRVYQVTFRAKWLAGSPQLNTRSYLNRLARTTILNQPALAAAGTPGAVNSRRIANTGPTFTDLIHAPVVPALGQAVTISVRSSDPDGLGAHTLFYSVNGGAFASVAMTNDGMGRFTGTIPGQPMSGFTVQFYVQGADSAGATSTFPAAGPNSRALYKVGDGGVASQPVANKLRLIMRADDAAAMHAPIHSVSNFRWPATLIANDREVFYDIRVRLRSSPYGRQGNRTGWNLDLDPEQPFRGTETGFVLDGAFNMPLGNGGGWIETTLGPSINEMLFLRLAERVGGVPTEIEDVAYVATPYYENRRCQLRLRRYTNAQLDDFLPNGGDGSLFKQEIIYYPTTTVDGNPESLKNPYSTFTAVDIVNMGTDKNAYRFNYLPMNHRDRDSFTGIIAMGTAFGGPTANLYAASDAALDLDSWSRTLAFNALTGLADTYNQHLPHNIQFLTRPDNGKVMLLPWDLDHAFYFATNFSPYGGAAHRVKDLIADARFKRRMASHLHDMCNNGFSNAYLDPWIDHLNAVAGKTYNSNFKNWVASRRTFVLSQLATDFPATAFTITTNGGGNFSVAAPTTVLAGNAWIDVHRIRKAGAVEPLDLTWTNGSAWQVVVPLGAGANPITLEGLNYQGAVVATDTITITNTGPNVPAAAGNLVVSEIMYHPANPTSAEITAGFSDADDFEWIELMNISANVVDLADASFTDGIAYTFPASTLAPGARLLLVRNPAAFAFRHGAIPVAGTYTGSLNNAGDHLLLLDRGNVPILDFSYGDDLPWPPDADGNGRSLVLKNPAANPPANTATNWRVSIATGGNPNTGDTLSLAAYPTLLDYAVTQTPAAAIVTGYATFEWRERIGADEATVTPQLSADLAAPWQSDPGDGTVLVLLSNTANPDGTRTMKMRAATPAATRQFFRLRVTAP